LAFWSAEAAFWSAVLAAFWLLEAAFWSAVELLGEAAFWSAVPWVVLAGGFCAVVVLVAAAFWSVVVLLVVALELWLVAEPEAGGFTGALALSLCPEAGLVVVAAGALLVLVGALLVLLEADAAFWSAVEDAVPCAGGFTGAFALSPWAGA
jgi:hypothetical protein